MAVALLLTPRQLGGAMMQAMTECGAFKQLCGSYLRLAITPPSYQCWHHSIFQRSELWQQVAGLKDKANGGVAKL